MSTPISNMLADLHGFLQNTGVFCKTQEEADYIIELLSIKIEKWHWNSSKTPKGPKRKLLIRFNENWRFIHIDKCEIEDHVSVDEVREWVKQLASPKVRLRYAD